MPEMNPYYARDSKIGPVFDVATWNSRFAFASILMALGMCAAFAAAAYVFYDPAWLKQLDGEIWTGLHTEILKVWKAYPLYSQIGLAVAALLSYIGLAGAVSTVADFYDGNFYLRVGPGGISLRVPDGLDFTKLGFASAILELDLPWNDIRDWKVTQTKKLGSMSPHTGNITAQLDIRNVAGKKHVVNLDHFQENGHIIWKRMGEAAEMTALQFEHAPNDASQTQPVAAGSGEMCDVIEAVLIKQLYSEQCSAIFSDEATGKFVQFAVGGGEILLDLPCQALDDFETSRADEFFTRYGGHAQESELLDRPGGVAVGVQRSYQINLGSDVERAVELTLGLFRDVYLVPEEFALTVEAI